MKGVIVMCGEQEISNASEFVKDFIVMVKGSKILKWL